MKATTTYTNNLTVPAHGDVAAEATLVGTRSAAYTFDPFGLAFEAVPASSTTERWTGQWDKKLDTSTQLIEMGARPYDAVVGRFLGVDPIEGGSLNHYDYAAQDPVNGFDLTGKATGSGFVAAEGGGCWATCGYWRQYMDPQPPWSFRQWLSKVKRSIINACRNPLDLMGCVATAAGIVCAVGGLATGGALWVACGVVASGVGAAVSITQLAVDPSMATSAGAVGAIAIHVCLIAAQAAKTLSSEKKLAACRKLGMALGKAVP